MRTIVHLSDLHFGRLDPALVSPLVDAVNGIAPDLVVVSGDLTQRARRSEFLEARAFLERLRATQFVVPGNHDIPLYNVAARLLAPLGGYKRFIASDLEPVVTDDEMVVVGLNTARSVILYGLGRLNATQVRRAADRLRAAPPEASRVVVTHHPFDVPHPYGSEHVVGRSEMAMTELAAAGADVFLAGHLHVSHIGHTADRYKIAGHSAVVVQAGTLSMRGRGEANSFNVLRLAHRSLTVERHSWTDARATFLTSWKGEYRREAGQWTESKDVGV